MQTRLLVSVAFFLSAGCLFCAAPALPQSSQATGKLKVHVEPKQAYLFVDGKAIGDGSQTIRLAAGSHNVSVYNYGYQPKTENVHIDARKKADLNIVLQSSGDKVSGPFAEIEFKGDPRAAVLLTGTTPAYFVGHVDEFDWDWIWHQRLLVKPGSYQVTVTREGNTMVRTCKCKGRPASYGVSRPERPNQNATMERGVGDGSAAAIQSGDRQCNHSGRPS